MMCMNDSLFLVHFAAVGGWCQDCCAVLTKPVEGGSEPNHPLTHGKEVISIGTNRISVGRFAFEQSRAMVSISYAGVITFATVTPRAFVHCGQLTRTFKAGWAVARPAAIPSHTEPTESILRCYTVQWQNKTAPPCEDAEFDCRQ